MANAPDPRNLYRPPAQEQSRTPDAPTVDDIEAANTFSERIAGLTFALFGSGALFCASHGIIVRPSGGRGGRVGELAGFLLLAATGFIAVMFAYQYGHRLKATYREFALVVMGLLAAVLLLITVGSFVSRVLG